MHGINIQIHTSPFFYKASRVPSWRRVPREVPTSIAHGRCAPCGGVSCKGSEAFMVFHELDMN